MYLNSSEQQIPVAISCAQAIAVTQQSVSTSVENGLGACSRRLCKLANAPPERTWTCWFPCPARQCRKNDPCRSTGNAHHIPVRRQKNPRSGRIAPEPEQAECTVLHWLLEAVDPTQRGQQFSFVGGHVRAVRVANVTGSITATVGRRLCAPSTKSGAASQAASASKMPPAVSV